MRIQLNGPQRKRLASYCHSRGGMGITDGGLERFAAAFGMTRAELDSAIPRKFWNRFSRECITRSCHETIVEWAPPLQKPRFRVCSVCAAERYHARQVQEARSAG